MKKGMIIAIIACLMMPMMIFGQTYSSLWKKAEEAEKKDLPKSQYETLQPIVQKATKEKVYGQLLKAELNACQVMQGIAPDSIKPAVARIQQRCDATTDPVLKVVYQTVLWRVWQDNPPKPVLSPELCERLAQAREDDYTPFVEKGTDSKIFDHDMLSVVGMELGDYQTLHDFYEIVGNRPAACLMALKVADSGARKDDREYLERLDSLIEVYGDLPEAGEIAIERFAVMGRMPEAFTAEEKIY